jgi:uncharacterized protein
MTANKRTVRRYMEAFDRGDHAAVLDCLTEDVQWVLPGAFHHHGKHAFEREIGNEAFVGTPDITVSRVIEEGGVVVTEGEVRTTRRDGARMHLVFCDVFEMEEGLIRKLTSYLMEVPADAAGR